MSDENSSNVSSTTASSQKTGSNLEIKKANTEELLKMNDDGTAVYLKADSEENGKVIIKAKEPVRNAINGRTFRGINQIILQNDFAKNNIKDREVLTFDQGKDLGLRVKKGSKAVRITIRPYFDQEIKAWNVNTFSEFPAGAFFAIGEDGKPKSARGDIALAKLNEQRLNKINRMRALMHSEKVSDEYKAKLLESIAYEHKKNHDYIFEKSETYDGKVLPKNDSQLIDLKVKEWNGYWGQSVQTNEANILENLIQKIPTPSLNQQKGRAVAELEREKEYQEKNKSSERPVINAENTTNPSEYVGKYLAACELGADFVTDKASQAQVQSVIGKNLQKAIDNNDFDYIQTFGAECSEHCKSCLSTFRKLSYEQQRGIQNERPVDLERPEQTVDEISR